ncbi:hypothetical protein B0H67DRAFT_305632 [Lasiosphaeris hirsuta]|uniref:Uncharacterized protein n=1 Tax=Lasiosphaeris hirsuta TaxID=260670 RepID=A0AA40AA41_9PEZI|nr:hypothetical protein B0H67DRAFT_305632 [Lasiosphaeris hirsuta]
MAALNGAPWNDIGLYDHRTHCPSGDCQFGSFETLEFCVDSGIVKDVAALLPLDGCGAGFGQARFEATYKAWNRTEAIGDTEDFLCTLNFSPIGHDIFYDEMTYRLLLRSYSADGALSIKLQRTNMSTELVSFKIYFPISNIDTVRLDNLTDFNLNNPTAPHIAPRIQVREPLTALWFVQFSAPPPPLGQLRLPGRQTEVGRMGRFDPLQNHARLVRDQRFYHLDRHRNQAHSSEIYATTPRNTWENTVTRCVGSSGGRNPPTAVESPVQTDPRTGVKFTVDPSSMAFLRVAVWLGRLCEQPPEKCVHPGQNDAGSWVPCGGPVGLLEKQKFARPGVLMQTCH